MIGIDEPPEASSPLENAGTPLHVAVVAGDQALRHGLVRLLAQDPRLRLLDPVADLAELRTTGLQYDACVLGLPETGFSDTVTEFMRAVPCVVWIPALGIPTLGEQADGWRHWVASWVRGARGVVGHDVARVAFADAVLSAARSPHDLHPHIARALLEATSATDLGVSATLAGTLGEVAKGRRTAAAMSASGTSAATHALDLAHLRDACERAGLGVPRRSGDGRRRHDRGDAFEPGVIPPEALMLSSRVREVLRCYADGYDYEEIAQHLNISETTVKSHVLSAMDKFGITHNRSSEVRQLFAIYISGRHSRPDLLLRRLDRIRSSTPAVSARLPVVSL
ncbi:helix-turn-helix transcriptional regulator [Streptomyces parvus]|uniref:helix-turn-helix transcriptional regulator n=1 Tax=Streptomyces parvus TaxID=66428 RepID=UPI002100EDA6|nr:helix-turn-helix domain-containing protein [Streptomyces parvus]MCQ1578675.1 LuxR C-terminal-related transcriptional regulator [Streptomyces parvus]